MYKPGPAEGQKLIGLIELILGITFLICTGIAFFLDNTIPALVCLAIGIVSSFFGWKNFKSRSG